MQRTATKKYLGAKHSYSQQNWVLSYSEAVMQQNQRCNNDEVPAERNSIYKKANMASASAFR